MGMTARSSREHEDLGDVLDRLPRARINASDYERAWEVQGLLAMSGRHRGVALPDPLVAACAERLGLTVVHCDADLIAEFTGQPTCWAVDRGLL